MKSQYDEGFFNGVVWCARCLRLAALEVEKPVMGKFQGVTGPAITAVVRSGRSQSAHTLREIANILEHDMREEYAKSEPTPVERVHETPTDGGQQKR